MLKYFRVRNNRTLFGLKVWWNSLGLWSRLTGKNKVMSYLLRRHRRYFIRIGNLVVLWGRRRLAVTRYGSYGISLPNPPQMTKKNLRITVVYDASLIPFGKTQVVIDSRTTEDALDDLRKKLQR